MVNETDRRRILRLTRARVFSDSLPHTVRPPPQYPSGERSGVLTALDDQLAVDHHGADPRRVLVGIIVGGPVPNQQGVEHRDVRPMALL